jgi:hypothetical protein
MTAHEAYQARGFVLELEADAPGVWLTAGDEQLERRDVDFPALGSRIRVWVRPGAKLGPIADAVRAHWLACVTAPRRALMLEAAQALHGFALSSHTEQLVEAREHATDLAGKLREVAR